MIKRGILVFDHLREVWNVWVGQNGYGVEQGQTIDLRIKNQYYRAWVGKDFDWFVTLDNEVSFTLRPYEIYKVKIYQPHFQAIEAPF